MMKQNMAKLLASLLCLGFAAPITPARALMVAPQPIARRLATADCVVVGKVVAFGEKTVSVPVSPGAKNKRTYQIAIVEIESNVLGAEGKKKIRVGFVPPTPPPSPSPDAGGLRPHIRRRPFRGVLFTLEQEACLFLSKHPTGDFYTAPFYFSVINKKGNTNFDKEMKEVRHCAKLLADPEAGFDAKDKADRLLTAGMLVANYRRYRPNVGQPKSRPIDAETSKKILHTLADADWNARPRRPGSQPMTPRGIFTQLNLTAQDGWKPPKDFRQFDDKARQWCKDNADKYIIHRFVFEKKDRKAKDGAK